MDGTQFDMENVVVRLTSSQGQEGPGHERWFVMLEKSNRYCCDCYGKAVAQVDSDYYCDACLFSLIISSDDAHILTQVTALSPVGEKTGIFIDVVEEKVTCIR